MKMTMKVRAALMRTTLIWAIAAWNASAWALSLRSTKAEVFLGEARPGATLSFSRAEGEPLGVENAGGEQSTIEFAASIPSPQEMAEGYDPLPDMSWVRLDAGTRRMVMPGQSAKTDIVVGIPKDARLEDGQYAFDCLIKGRNAAGSMLTLKTRLSFAVGDGDSPDEHKQCPGGFDVSPREGAVEDVPLGQRTELRDKTFRGLKLINAGGKALTVRLATSRAWPQELHPPEGFAPAPNPRWLKTGPVVRVPAGAIVTVPLHIRIPDRPRYAGRKWSFLLALDVEDGKEKGRRWFVMSVTTKTDRDQEKHSKH